MHTEHCAALLLVGEVRGEISNPSDIELEGTEDTREIGHLQDYECCSMCHRGYLSFNDINFTEVSVVLQSTNFIIRCPCGDLFEKPLHFGEMSYVYHSCCL